MAGIHFTREQQEAIDTTDKSVLVSAAAGSGKTAVLIQRIIGIITSGKADVDQMVIVTFTNAAASEMKLKLMKAIRKEMSTTSDRDRRRELSRQLDIMHRANISTFHGFAMKLIKEFFYKTDMEPGFRVIDDTRNSLLKIDTMEQLFQDCFEDDDLIPGGSFRDFMEHYSGDRNENAIRDQLIQSYEKLRAMPDYFQWAENCADQLADKGSIQDSPVYDKMCSYIRSRMDEAAGLCRRTHDLAEDAGCPKMAEKLMKDMEKITEWKDQAISGDVDETFFDAIRKPSFERMAATKAEKDAWNEIKDQVKALRDGKLGYKGILSGMADAFAPEGLETSFSEMYETEKYLRYYIGIMKEFEKRFARGKKELNAVDFGDIEHMALDILRDDGIAADLRERYRFFFIDEYQDTNYIQEALINRISRPDNVFRVGDVKQSIYRFRQAEPEIFMETRRRYASEDNRDAVAIDLNSNFRSSGSTVAYINDVFAEIMPGYDDSAALKHGRKDDPTYYLTPEVDVLVKDQGDDEEPDMEALAAVDTDDEESAVGSAGAGSGEKESPGNIDAEARFVAKRAGEIIGTEFFDGSIGKVRRATPRDIVVLMRSTKGKADSYYKAMQEAGIPAYVNDDSGYFDTVEIGLALRLIQLVENTRRDIPLISVLHSGIFGFSAGELAVIRAEASEQKAVSRQKPYYQAFFWYCASGGEAALREKCCTALESIRRWQEKSVSMELEDFLWYVLVDSGLYMLAGAMYGGAQKQANLRSLADKALEYRQGGVASLGGFISYLELLKKREIKTGQIMTVGEEDDLVRIMTIHKSKGLEFPFVIVAGLGAQRMRPKLMKGVQINADEGMGITFVDREKGFHRPTVIQQLIYEKDKEDEYQEDLRVLYVALTRAKEKLMLVGTVNSEEKLDGEVAGRNTYLDILHNVLKTPDNEFNIRPADVGTSQVRPAFFTEFMTRHSKIGDLRSSDGYSQVASRLEFSYPYRDDLELPAKYSVSRLRLEELEGNEATQAEPLVPDWDDEDEGVEGSGHGSENGTENRVEHEPVRHVHLSPYGSAHTITAAEKGTAYHRIMEYVDFSMACEDAAAGRSDYVMERARELVDKRAIREDVFNVLDMEMILGFFRSELGQRAGKAAAAGLLRKEKPFTLRTERNGRNILVQGIIDCCFQEGDSLVLIDYKSSSLRSGFSHEEELERIKDEYRPQLCLYKEALEYARPYRVEEIYIYLFHTGECLAL